MAPDTEPNLYELCDLKNKMSSYIGDVRDLENMQKVFDEVQPEIVIHMAAQPLVRESYKRPVYTYETNVMGTVNVLECVRNTPSVKSVVNVTTDKVYKNVEQDIGYVETDTLDGYEPYSIRPFQHVLEPVVAYLMVAMEQWHDKEKCGSYNVGPADVDCWATGRLTDLFCEKWNLIMGRDIKWINKHDGGPHELNIPLKMVYCSTNGVLFNCQAIPGNMRGVKL